MSKPETNRYHALAPMTSAVALLAVLFLGLHSGSAMAEADGPDYYRVTGVATNDVLNIRAEPNPRSAAVGSISPNADCLRNLGCQGGLTFQEYSTLSMTEQAVRLKENPRWYQVEYQGTTGWVAGRYLAEGGCSR